MIKVEFDAAHLTDAVTKAAKVAPSKGDAFDKAAGLLLEVFTDGTASIKSTDLDTSYFQRIPVATSNATQDFAWRIPSKLIARTMPLLDLESGALVTFFDKDDSYLRMKQKRFNAKFSMLDPKTFPVIRWFDPAGMVEANDFASKVSRVSWAASKGKTDKFSGVHIDEKGLVATDGYVMAAIDAKVAVDEPITVSVKSIDSLLSKATDVSIRATEMKLEMMLDAETQVTTTVFIGEYPNVRAVMRDNFTGQCQFSKQEFSDAMDRLLAVVEGEKLPRLDITIEPAEEAMTLLITTPTNVVQDCISISTNDIEVTEWRVTPDNIMSAVSGVKGQHVTFKYGHPSTSMNEKATLGVTDGYEGGYVGHISPRQKTS